MSSHIEARRDGPVLVLRLARADKKNALTQAMYAAFADALDAASGDESVRVCVLLGAPGVFTAGNDIADFVGAGGQGQGLGAIRRFLRSLATFGRPLFAGVDGLAVGIGATLLFHCDYVLATPRTVLRAPFTALGLTPEAGTSLLGPRRMGHPRAFEFLVMGEDISAERAMAAGLVNRIVEPDDLEPLCLAQARRVAAKSAAAVIAARRLLKGDPADVLARIDAEIAIFTERLASAEAQAAFAAFLTKESS